MKKYRRLIEIFGLSLLIVIIWREQTTIKDALAIAVHTPVMLLLSIMALAWLNFVWSVISYKILAPKVSIRQMLLVVVAASGAGRVVPAGAGQASFATIYLHSKGYKTAKALSIAATNNVAGFLVNITFLIPAVLAKPSIRDSINIQSSSAIFGLLVLAAVAVLLSIVLKRSSKTKHWLQRFIVELKKVGTSLAKMPQKSIFIVLVMFAQMSTHSLILLMASHATASPITATTAFIAMSTGVALGSFLPTPGGVGGVEAGLIAALYALGMPLEQATAAALLYRLSTYIQPLIPGLASYFYLRRKNLL